LSKFETAEFLGLYHLKYKINKFTLRSNSETFQMQVPRKITSLLI